VLFVRVGVGGEVVSKGKRAKKWRGPSAGGLAMPAWQKPQPGLKRTYELIHLGPFGGGNLFEFDGEELGNITKLGLRILLLHPRSIRIRIQKERTHVALGTVRILLLFLALALGLFDDLLFLLDGVDVFFVGAHGYGGGLRSGEAEGVCV